MTSSTRICCAIGLAGGLAALAGCATAGAAVSPGSAPASAQSTARPIAALPPPSVAGTPKLTSEALITEASIRSHMEFLASDALNGRGSGTRDEWITATYIASQFRQWGLEPMGDDGGFVQQIEIRRPTVTAPPRVAAGSLTLTHGVQILVTSLGGAEASGPLVRYDAAMAAPRGSTVLLPAGATANSAGGASIVLLPATEQITAQWATRAGRLPTLPAQLVGVTAAAPRPIVVYLNDEAYASVAALPPGTPVTARADVGAGTTSSTWNAVGRLSGSDPRLAEEVIVLSAHLDHTGTRDVAAGQDGINNGADDDASGTIAVMELARAFAAGERPARTLLFALFGSEERGGYGAGYFVERPVVPLDRIVADLQFEMLGRPDALLPPHTLWLTGYERSNLGAELAARGARLVADPHPEESFFTRSDNIRFARRGVVAHTVSSFGLHTDYHRPSDEIEMIDFAHMTEAIQSMLEPIRWFAGSAFRPAWTADGCPAPCGR